MEISMVFKRSVICLKRSVLAACVLIVIVSSEDCSSVSDCQCKLSNGSVINLKPIASENRFPRFSFLTPPNVSENSFGLLFYDPCEPFDLTVNSLPEGSSSCTGVLGCVIYPSPLSDNVSSSPLGDWSDVKFTTESITYKKSDKTLTVKLNCSESIHNPVAILNESSTDSNFQITLKSKCACVDGCSNSPNNHKDKGGLSVGSILLIITFTLFVAYIVGGILWNGICLGATGVEMLPNISFWRDFPSLIVEGANYSVSCCKSRSSYDRV